MSGFYKYLLSTYDGPGTVLDAEDIMASQANSEFCPYLQYGKSLTLTFVSLDRIQN